MERSLSVERQPRWKRLLEWLDQRYRIMELVDAALEVYIPKDAKTYYLGGITLFLFMVQVVTGSLLTLYYQPTPDTAYESVLYIMSEVNFGWLIRSIHAWGANLMVLTCMLHLLRVFFQGAYKVPREVTWLIGVGLLLLTMGLGFTGYLLPWNQRAYWATTVGTEIAGAVPVVGHYLRHFLRAGEDVTAATLTRFFSMHTILLPVSLGGLILIHLLLIHQQGLASPSKPARLPTEEEEEEEEGLPFFPHYILEESIAWYVLLGVLIVLASLFPAPVEEKADPFRTPSHIKPEWYFLWMYQMLKLVPRTVGILIPGVGVAVLALLPFVDKNPGVRPRERPVAIFLGILVVLAIIALTIWGMVV